jgi:purine-binding chemotaxis protein CheW
MNYLSFKLVGVEYAVDVSAVETVVDHGSVLPVPSPLPYMRGVMDLRGRVIPVIDLRRKFGLPGVADCGSMPVIVISVADGGKKDFLVGAFVDEVSEVLSISDEAVEASRGDGANLWERYVRGIARFDGRMIVMIGVEGLFSLKEIESLDSPRQI